MTAPQTTVERAWSARWRSWLDDSIGVEIARLRARYQLSVDEFRGLYVSDEQVDVLAAGREPGAAGARAPLPAAEPETPLGRVAAQFGLGAAEAAALFVVLAPELHGRYETLFAYLNDDVTRRHATVDLCRTLTGAGPGALDLECPLFAGDLVEPVPQPGRSWRSSGLLVRGPVRRFLLGGHEAGRAASAVTGAAAGPGGSTDRAACVVIVGGPPEEARSAAEGLAAAAGRHLVEAGPALSPDAWTDDVVTARLHRAWLYASLHGLEGLTSAVHALVRRTAAAPLPTVFAVGREWPWRALFEGVEHEAVQLSPPGVAERDALWRRRLAEDGVAAPPDDVRAVARLFALYPGQIGRASAYAARISSSRRADRAVLSASARRVCTSALDGLAVRVSPVHSWADLVLPAPTMRRLRELAGAVLERDRVFREWSFLRPSGGSTSLRALFAGASGTGKTLSAAVVAREVGLELFRIDLSAVVSKYIGETEKNLERIFTAAEGSNALLLFDEADALFGKRSEVKDAHDRYANIEVAYLLQRMESYDGVMILATNLPRNVDEAFSRRIHFDLEFPLPDTAERERLWRLLLPVEAPTAPDVDVAFLARQFPLSGGEIRNAALAAAFLAAHEGSPITMGHLVRAVARQRRRQGKLPTAAEFKYHLASVRADGA